MPERLTSICGPHCGVKDGHVGHCQTCHDLLIETATKMAAHERVNREREQWRRDNVNGGASVH